MTVGQRDSMTMGRTVGQRDSMTVGQWLRTVRLCDSGTERQ